MDLLLNKLADLKQNYHAIGLKAEFESEGATLEEVLKLRELSSKTGLDLTVKIGGCGALKDIRDTKLAKADAIVAPMIESKYALQKFVETYNNVYKDQKLKLYINIETISGFNVLDEILSSEYFEHITGIVYGRGDMANSMNISDAEDESIINIAKIISNKLTKVNKELIIGGKIIPQTLNNLEDINFTGLETRKIIFDSNVNRDEIIKALEFEMMWIKEKSTHSKEDAARLQLLEKRYIHV